MFKKTIQISFLNLTSFIFQFLLNLFITTQFGIGLQLDLYNKSITIPNYLIVLLTSCVTYIFIPLYSKINKEEKEKAPEIINEYFVIVSFFSLLFLFLSYIFSSNIIMLFEKNIYNEERNQILNIFLIYSPIIFFSTLSEFLNTILYTNSEFKIPLLWKIINPILVILLVYFFQKKSIYIALSYLIAFLIQFIYLFIYCKNKYFKFSLIIKKKNVFIRNRSLINISLPLIFSILLTKTFPVFDVYFLSSFSNGIVSNVLLSQKLINTLSFVLNSFFSVLFFSQIAGYAAEKNYEKLFEMLLMGIKSMFLITIPIIFFLLHNSEPLFKFLFLHGKFSENDSVRLSETFKYFLIGLPVISIGSIISYAIYSLRNLKLFYFTSIVEVFVYISTAYLMSRYFSYNSIAVAYVTNFIISNILLFTLLKKNLQSEIKILGYSFDFFKIMIASLIFIPYYINTFSNKILLDCIYFSISFLIYLLILLKFKFGPVSYLYNKIRINEI